MLSLRTLVQTIFWLVVLASLAGQGQNQVASDQAGRRMGVPVEYIGGWVCQSAVPGYNLPLPVIPGQAPSMQRMTTMPSTVVIKFTLNGDGTYEAQNAKGQYSFNPAAKTIAWLDGSYRQQLSKTEISRRSDGAPSLDFIANDRYYGCFMAKESSGAKSNGPASRETAATSGGGHYTKEQFLALGREGAKAFAKKDYITARRIFEDLVRDNPNDADGQAALGVVMLAVGETSGSLVHLSRGIELNPRELNTYVNRGQAYLRLGRRQEAEADLKKAISFDPAGKDPRANRARALLKGTIRP